MTEKPPLTELTNVERFNLQRNLKAAFEVYRDLESPLKQKLMDFLIDGSDPGCLIEIKSALSKAEKPFFEMQNGTVRAKESQHGSVLLKVFHQHPTPSGYFHRLAEWLALHDGFAESKLQGDERLPYWLNVLARGSQGMRTYYTSSDLNISIASMTQGLTTEEMTSLVRVLVERENGDYHSVGRTLYISGDVVALFDQHPEDLCSALRSVSSNSVEIIIDLLVQRNFENPAVIPTIVDLLTEGGKKIRAVATPLLALNLDAAKAPLLTKLKEGSASVRTVAAETIALLYGKQMQAEIKEALDAEKGARLRQTLESLLAQMDEVHSTDPTTASTSDAAAIELPVIEMPPDPLPLPNGFRDSLAKMFAKAMEKFQEHYQKQLNHYNSSERHTWMSKPDYPSGFTAEFQNELCDYLEGKAKLTAHQLPLNRAILFSPFESWCDVKQLHLIHVLRLMNAAGIAHATSSDVRLNMQMLESHRRAQDNPYGLREIDAALGRAFGDVGSIVKSYLGYRNSEFDLEDEAVWPYFYEHANELRDALLGLSTERNDYWLSERRRNAITVAGMFPAMPKVIENAVWLIALGEGKADRPLARRALKNASGGLERGLQAIVDGKQLIRIAGAELLAELGNAAAVEPLKKALKAEKQETVKGSFLQAIEVLGGDVEEFLGRRKQLLDAKKALEKKMPKGMEWFPLDALPTVRWKEDNKAVASEILRWWVIQSVQFKLPTCGAMLRRAMGMCRTDDAAALARFVLTAWIGYDTQVPNPSEILAAATERAHKEYQTVRWIRDYYETEEKYRDELVRQLQGQFLNSAIGEKGALAIVSAGGDKHCVRIIEKFIRTHHGHRLAQSKALLEVLGWIDDPLAIQVLLSIGNRFRTAAIRKRAAELVQELADRKGWTMEQLADRTIPDAGFVQARDEKGQPVGKRAELVLDYGARKFIVIMNDDLEPVISRDDGKEVKALPAAAKEDDPDLVKAAKAEFTAAKKTVKDVVKLLAEQLYEAVCSQRTWIAGEWKSFLAMHPIAGVLCRRVIWRTHPIDAPEKPVFFRPLEDGTFTDAEDNSVELTDTDVITVAHSSLMTSEQEQAWISHLKDYEVPKLFVQFGRTPYRLTENDANKTDIDAFQGHMLTTFLLRNKATKLGWQRGSAQDGGSFCDYFKPFRAVGITATIEFTGSYLPEGDIPAAIRGVYFVPIKNNQDESDTWNANKMKLSKVPPILISECYNDLRDIAAEGSGYDAEWEKKGMW